MSIDTPENRARFQDLVAQHYLGCDTGDLGLATAMMLPDVKFTLPPMGLVFNGPAETRRGLADVITKLPRMARHRPAGFQFVEKEPGTLRATFTTNIMSCVDGRVHAIGDITVDAILHEGRLAVRAWEVRPIYFQGLLVAGRLARLPRLLLTLVPFLLPKEVRALFAAAAGMGARG